MSTPKTSPMTYNDYVAQIGVLAVVGTATQSGVTVGVDDDFNAIIPQMLNYAELRIQRDLDLLASVTTSTAYSMTQNVNVVAVSTSDFVTVQTVALVVGTKSSPLTPVSKEFLQNVYTDTSQLAAPQYFAMLGGDADTGGATSIELMFGPYPDQTYQLRITGTQRMPSLAKFNTAPDASTKYTFISSNLPDLLLMASMVYISGFQRNFGRQSDDPQMAQSYESQYKALLNGAGMEAYRQKMRGEAGSAQTSTPFAGKQGR